MNSARRSRSRIDIKSEVQENIGTIEKWLQREESSITLQKLSSNASAHNPELQKTEADCEISHVPAPADAISTEQTLPMSTLPDTKFSRVTITTNAEISGPILSNPNESSSKIPSGPKLVSISEVCLEPPIETARNLEKSKSSNESDSSLFKKKMVDLEEKFKEDPKGTLQKLDKFLTELSKKTTVREVQEDAYHKKRRDNWILIRDAENAKRRASRQQKALTRKQLDGQQMVREVENIVKEREKLRAEINSLDNRIKNIEQKRKQI
ncbi:hypothetical protein Ddc_10577 [Ditylenchus destructor]|nr:hypothetical protein Ddc_10577 [Ditylenchus destructor]